MARYAKGVRAKAQSQREHERPTATAKGLDESAARQEIADELKSKVEYEWIPLGSQEPIRLSLHDVHNYLVVKTKTGQTADAQDLKRFLEFCRSNRLNPYVKDAWLVGYDVWSKGDERRVVGKKFETITAYQALAKRAEADANYDGIEAGVIVQMQPNDDEERATGCYISPGDRLVGAWAVGFRKDRSHPYEMTINLNVFIQVDFKNRPMGRWAVDPAGQLVKCAKAAVLREMYPSATGAMYIAEEMSDEGPTLRQLQEVGMKPAAKTEPVVEPDASDVLDDVEDDDAPQEDEYSEEYDEPDDDDGMDDLEARFA
jgi:phage recombination protein Bet